MILAAREAGDLANQGKNLSHVDGDDMTSLDRLGISRDLAAYAVQVAKIPEEIWAAGLC